ncbi:permease [Thiospirochaeta perfilievii]|uniref:Permease n=1 Tax=Thiospirochaeta perfilievii TaxID=252967 RepID=A0A5C1Q7V7_9SPIO|nr:permease [Thiospirochaeta perfilievii]QEN03477.1 permease [Thiospirochaeta perfilievii]
MFIVFTRFANWLTYTILNLDPTTKIADAVHFFIEDTSKIFVLILVMIYLIAILRASMNMERVRDTLQGRSKWFGYSAGSLFGAITPFCSCSSIPMFLGFTAAGIPTGVTLSFLITSPLLNEVAIVLLGSLLGLKFTITYLIAGISVGILGGIFFDKIGADKMLQPMAQKLYEGEHKKVETDSVTLKLSLKDRHNFAKKEAIEIFSRIWKWVLLGVGIGAGLHGFVPQSWIIHHLGDGAWWTVPSAVLLGIPLYSNASGMIPIIETLLLKGLPVGTSLAFMLSTVGASFPEFLMLKQVLKPRLLVYLFGYFLIAFTFIGLLINMLF